jgi:hypothetical protein
MAMTEDHGTPGSDVIDVAIPIGIVYHAAVSPIHKDRVTTDRFTCPHRTVDPTWDYLFCMLKQFSGTIIIHRFSPFLSYRIFIAAAAAGFTFFNSKSTYSKVWHAHFRFHLTAIFKRDNRGEGCLLFYKAKNPLIQ